MKITIVYPNWTLLRERADVYLKGGGTSDFYMAVTVMGEDKSLLHPDAYEVVYNEEVKFDDLTLNHLQILERLFEQFNIGDHGGRRDLRSMSVGDQVSLDGDVYVCKPCGWEQITGLIPRWD